MSEHELEAAEAAERARAESADDLKYKHVIATVMERPWAIRPSTLAVIVDLLSYRSLGHRLTQAEVDARIGEGQRAAAGRRRASQEGGNGAVAVLPLFGIIAPRASMVSGVSGPAGTGIDAFTQMFRSALADPSVGSILIEVDSPGGRVDQVPELAAEIRKARGDKPIVAIANAMAGSAAYWIASQCDELVVTPSGEVGSIGVYCAHQDFSGQLEQEGVVVTLISAGKFKTEGNPFEPLSEEALAAIQTDIDAFYSMFTADVAKGRGVALDDVKNGFGQGRMVMARDAVKAGMADRVGTFDETVQRLASGAPIGGKKALGAAVAEASANAPGAKTLEVKIVADTSELDATLARAEERAAKIAATAAHDPEGGTPSNLEFVPGAESLLRHQAVREAFPGPNN